MSEWYKEWYIDRRTWLLVNAGKLKLTPAQFQILSLIDLLNERRERITSEILANLSGMSETEVDRIFSELTERHFLRIEIRGNSLRFRMEGVFRDEVIAPDEMPILGEFEKEFGRTLSSNEISRLIDWNEKYGEEEILDALRDASMYRKLSMSYIERVLKANHDKEI
ncbi:MAG: DnaD domain protein [Erysipelotrichales bacterium]|nr:DnaD domain protein [Erysipelotrichales bacterium]